MRVALNTSVPRTRKAEKESYWKQQSELHKESGLSRVKYCRLNNVNYDMFAYWISKWKKAQSSSSLLSSPLVTVKLKSSIEPLLPQSCLCTLSFSGGSILKIHDTQALRVILEKLR